MTISMEKTITVQSSGVRFSVEVSGNSPQIVFVHGFSESKLSWEYLWRELSVDIPAMRYDLRGFGQSKLDVNVPFSHAQDLKDLLQTMGIDNCTLVGNSMGGGVALKTAIECPELVNNLVLFCPAVDGWKWSDDWRSRWHATSEAAKAGDLDKAKDLWWQNPVFDSVRNTPLEPKAKAIINSFHGEQWVTNYLLPAISDIERIDQLSLPTTVITGGRDLPDFIEISEFMANNSPWVKRLHYPEQGHLISSEIPQLLATEIRDFIKECKE